MNQKAHFSLSIWLRENAQLVAIFFSALVVRLLYIAQTSRGRGEITADASIFHQYAINLFQHGTFVSTDGYTWRTPGYPFFLGLISSLSGDSVLAVQAVQAILSSLTCVLLYFCAWALFKNRKWSLFAAWVSVFYFDLYTATPKLLGETLYTFSIVIFFVLILREHQTLRDSFVSGVAAGIIALIRPDFLLFAGIYGLYVWVTGREQKFKRALCYGLAVTLLYGPWIARNYVIHGRFIPTVLHSTANTYIGLYYPLDNLGLVPTIHEYTPKGMTDEIQIHEYYKVMVKRLYATIPLRTILLAYLRNFSGFLYPFLPAYDTTFVLLLPFWAVGIYRAVRDRNSRGILLSFMIVSSIGIYSIINGTAGPRFRQPLSPAFLLMAVLALHHLFKTAPRKPLVVVLAAWISLNIGVKVGQTQIRSFYKTSGQAFLRKMITSSDNPLGKDPLPVSVRYD